MTLWSSRPAFYLASIGAAVGLGSIWRLPYQLGSSGGSAFMCIFAIACLVIATPLLTAEFLIGRRSRLSPPEAAGAVAVESGLTRRWNVIGGLGTISVTAIMASYTVVAGWVLAYSWKCASGGLSGLSRPEVARVWRTFLSNPVEMGAWHIFFLFIVGVISAGGLSRGVEAASKVRAPVLLILLIVLGCYALAAGDARAGLRFALAPNFAAITPQVVLAAAGQAFYATGVGAAMMVAYGSYAEKSASLVRAALVITGATVLVSLLATLIIFPLVFRYGMDPAQGPELVFDVLATVFAEMTGGRVVGTLFFVLLVFGALTPAIAGFEPAVAWLQLRLGFSRRRAVAAAVSVAWLLGGGSILSFSRWSNWHPMAWAPSFENKTLFEILDFVPSNIFLPIGALATSILVGWRLSHAIVASELKTESPFARRWCVWALRYACPIAIAAVFAAAMW